MAFSDYLGALLRGGLPQVLDLGSAAPAGAQGDTRPEQTPPTPTPQHQEPFLRSALQSENLPRTLLIGGVVVLAVLGVVAVLRR